MVHVEYLFKVYQISEWMLFSLRSPMTSHKVRVFSPGLEALGKVKVFSKLLQFPNEEIKKPFED